MWAKLKSREHCQPCFQRAVPDTVQHCHPRLSAILLLLVGPSLPLCLRLKPQATKLCSSKATIWMHPEAFKGFKPTAVISPWPAASTALDGTCFNFNASSLRWRKACIAAKLRNATQVHLTRVKICPLHDVDPDVHWLQEGLLINTRVHCRNTSQEYHDTSRNSFDTCSPFVAQKGNTNYRPAVYRPPAVTWMLKHTQKTKCMRCR